MKRFLKLKLIFAFLIVAMLFGVGATLSTKVPAKANSSVGGNDYPWPNADMNSMSPLKFNYRNCTDYAAYEINEQMGGNTTNNIKFSWSSINYKGDGNAEAWKNGATGKWPIDTRPAVGSVAWWAATKNSKYGHVAIVASVSKNGNTIVVDEYNQNPKDPGKYGTRSLTNGVTNWPNDFIHIADISSGGSGVGTTDIIATEPNGTNSVKYMIGYNDGTGLNYNWGGTNLTLNTAPTQMVIADLNGDGKADILATEPSSAPGCSNGVQYMVGLSNGDGTFNWHFTNLTCNTPPTTLAVGNVQGNNRMDIIATEPSCTGGVKYMIGYNDGSGLNYNWGGTNLVCNVPPTHMSVADVNNDGKADIIATEPSCPGGVRYMVGMSNGNGTFNWDFTDLTCNTAPTQMGVGNVLGNGRQEIIATEPSCSGGVKYMIGYNDGSGLNYNWGGTNLTCNTLPTHMVLSDMNNDGKADIIATEPSCSGGVHYMVGLSNGDGTFNWDSTNLTCNTAPDQIGVGKAQG